MPAEPTADDIAYVTALCASAGRLPLRDPGST